MLNVFDWTSIERISWERGFCNEMFEEAARGLNQQLFSNNWIHFTAEHGSVGSIIGSWCLYNKDAFFPAWALQLLQISYVCSAAPAPIPIVMAPLFWANTHYFYFRVTTLAPLKPSEATFVGPSLLHLSNLLVACFNLKHGFKVLLVLNAISVSAASS